uniref:tRNA-intron lyase n=1 Tax=Parastrongyloides trichosuri TaxID=131310 RepID=A0A0N4Z7P5_PARTI
MTIFPSIPLFYMNQQTKDQSNYDSLLNETYPTTSTYGDTLSWKYDNSPFVNQSTFVMNGESLLDKEDILNEDDLLNVYNFISVDYDIPYRVNKVFIIVVMEDDGNYYIYHDRDAKIAYEKFRIYGEFNKLHVKDPKYLSIPIRLSRIQVEVLVEQGLCMVCERIVKDDCKGGMYVPIPLPDDEEIRFNAIKAVSGRKRKYGNLNEPLDIGEEELEITIGELRRKYEERRRFIREGTLEHHILGCCYKRCSLPFDKTGLVENADSLMVFRDLWRKGFWLVNGINFGCNYLAYDKNPISNHSKFMVLITSTSNTIIPLQLISTLRVSTQVNKDILLAIVDRENLLPYYTVMKWWKGDSIEK